MSATPPRSAEPIELIVGPIAHGGHCVARVDGQVVFVRHALPGERVRAVITEERGGFLRADAVEVLEPSADRVEPPCRYARPGLCGGCDFQHATPEAQRELKGAVVREQLARLGGLSAEELAALAVRVEPLPGAALGWRTRVQYSADADGRLGFHRHRSAEVVPVDRCPIAHPEIQALPLTDQRWPAGSAVEAVVSSDAEVTVFSRRSRNDRRVELISGPRTTFEIAGDRGFAVAADGFWQVHPAAPDTLTDAVLTMLRPRDGERAWDLYGGAGLFTVALAGAVGERGRVTLVESDPRGVAAARRNVADLPQVRVVRADVRVALADPRWRSVDLVVLDPPRSGAGREVVQAVTARRPRAVAYVACDPAAFARDVATFAAKGWRLTGLRAFDAFPMTHHVEVVGLLAVAEPGTV
ncbi:MAG TPA: TRAM domain-containing protein [Micromonosporaceae bacterium]|nr:TRAM domain-containing protein [Micromonosporaceae bacterium]